MLCSRHPLHRCFAPDCPCCGLLWVNTVRKCGSELFSRALPLLRATALHPTLQLCPCCVIRPSPCPHPRPRCAPALCAAPWCASSCCRLVQWMWSCCMMPRGGRRGEGDQPRPGRVTSRGTSSLMLRPPASSPCSPHCCFLAPSDSSPLQSGVYCKINQPWWRARGWRGSTRGDW